MGNQKAVNKKDIIKLGRIIDDKVQGESKNCFWGLDYTLAVIIRDYLRKFADTCVSVPTVYDKDWNLTLSAADDHSESVDEKHNRWTNHLREIADKFDYYIQNELDLLDNLDKDFLSYYHKVHPIQYIEEGNGMYRIEVQNEAEEDTARYQEIQDKITEISKKQSEIVKEAFNDLGKIFPDLWD